MTEDRDRLVAHGRRLMAGSSEVRANDIDYKIKRLMDKWQRLEDQMATRYYKTPVPSYQMEFKHNTFV